MDGSSASDPHVVGVDNPVERPVAAALPSSKAGKDDVVLLKKIGDVT
jgi:hypothetical protein